MNTEINETIKRIYMYVLKEKRIVFLRNENNSLGFRPNIFLAYLKFIDSSAGEYIGRLSPKKSL